MNIIETNLSFGSLSRRTSTTRIILHHAAASSITADGIHRQHKNQGWAGAGYHFLVRKDGKVYRLRPEWTVGAHATGSNYNSIGICAEGNFDVESMSAVQKKALSELVSAMKSKYGISTVQGHRDVMATACPGRNFPFAEIAGSKPSVPAQSKPTTGSTSGNSIASVQKWLNNNYGTGIVADGIYGTKTKAALVKALQTELNRQLGARLTVDGIMGSRTKSACPIIKVGMSGNITRVLQCGLICHGLSTNGFDGIYGTGTRNAVLKWQARVGIAQDGIAGQNTFYTLLK